MQTQFLQLTLPLQPTPAQIRDQIETHLKAHGDPLRWAIVHIDPQKNYLQIEGVVTSDTEDSRSFPKAS